MRAVCSTNASDWRTASSSSMTCTRLVGCIAEVLVRDAWHGEAKHRAASLIRLDDDLSAMVFDDGARNRQPDAHSQSLGRDEGLEQLGGNLRRDAEAAVGDADFEQVAIACAARDQQLAPRRLLHRLDRVADEVEQDLLDLHLVDQDEIVDGIDLEAHANAMLLGADEGKRACFLDQFLDALDAPFALAARDEVAQAANDLAGAQ